MKILGVNFAPLFIPLERRRQTFAVIVWVCSFLVFGVTSLSALLYLLFYTRFYFIPLLYMVWYVVDNGTPERGGRRWNWVRRWPLWKDYGAYFPITLVKESELDPKHNYILGSHPHGILCSGIFCNFGTEGTGVSGVFPGVTFYPATLNCQFILPLHREFFMSFGAVSASKRSIDYILTSRPGGNVVVLVIGGASEALDTHPYMENIVLTLKPRLGFIKLALKNGAHLVPSFSFGENEVYDQVDNPRGSRLREFQEFLRKWMSLAPVLVKGRGVFQYSFGLIPHRRPITTVVGKPIPVEKTANPTSEQIEELHSRYMSELEKLFERHKSTYYPEHPKVKLRFV